MSTPTRLFDQQALSKYVADLFVGIPEGHTSALVAYADTTGALKVSLAVKVDDHWRLGGQIVADLKNHRVAGSVAVQRSW